MLEAFVILGGVVIVLLVVGLVVDSKDVGRKAKSIAGGNGHGRAGRNQVGPGRQTGDQGGYLFISRPWS
jgi:hypothetical protein